MKTKDRLASLTFALSLASLLCVAGRAQETGQSGAKEYHASGLATTTATVESIDHTTREITLRSENGYPVTLTVGDRVKRLDEIKVGDTVTAVYYVSVASDFRPPTEEEKANPLVLVGETEKAFNEAQPSGGTMRVYKVVATIEGLDRMAPSLTIKGPRGKLHTVKVKDPSKLAELQLGSSIVVTYTEALAVGVEKAKPVATKE